MILSCLKNSKFERSITEKFDLSNDTLCVDEVFESINDLCFN